MKNRLVMMSSIISMSLALLATSHPVSAQTPTTYPDMYVGWKFGNGKADFGAAGKVFNTNVSGATTQKDDTGSFNSLYWGMRLNPNFGVELALAGANDFGSTDRSAAGSVRAKTNVSMFITDAVGYLPVSDNVTLYGKLGVAFTRTYAESALGGNAALAAGEKSKHDGAKTAAHFSIGASYRFSSNWDVKLDIDRFSKVGLNSGANMTGTAGITAVSVGLAYHF